MKNLLLIFFVIIVSTVNAQHVDTVFKTHNYTSYFDTVLKQPLYVTYTLYKGGGEISRDNLKFVTNPYTLSDNNYYKTGFDRGHLVPAEDMAYDSLLLKETFKYINVSPQYPNLNRGIWKVEETRVRELSQSDSLFIICGSFNFKRIGNLDVPQNCFKIVYSLTTNKILSIKIFTNETTLNVSKSVATIEELEKYTRFKISY